MYPGFSIDLIVACDESAALLGSLASIPALYSIESGLESRLERSFPKEGGWFMRLACDNEGEIPIHDHVEMLFIQVQHEHEQDVPRLT